MKIIEIFNSIDGEVNSLGQGHPFTFIRMAGCNLSCSYCDTSHSQNHDEGKEMSVEDILEEVEKIGCRYVLITGGEPLLNMEDLCELVLELHCTDYEISIETNGTISIPEELFSLVGCWKIDFKLQYKEKTWLAWEHNRHLLTKDDWLKIPVWSEETVLEAFAIIKSMIKGRAALSPIGISPEQVYQLIQKHNMFDVVLNIQVHKMIGFS